MPRAMFGRTASGRGDGRRRAGARFAVADAGEEVGVVVAEQRHDWRLGAVGHVQHAAVERDRHIARGDHLAQLMQACAAGQVQEPVVPDPEVEDAFGHVLLGVGEVRGTSHPTATTPTPRSSRPSANSRHRSLGQVRASRLRFGWITTLGSLPTARAAAPPSHDPPPWCGAAPPCHRRPTG